VGNQLFLERFIWFDQEARNGRWPNASIIARQFEVSTKTARRSIDHFRDRLQAPLEYDKTHKGYYYTDASFQLPVARLSQNELLALLISRKLITEASAGSCRFIPLHWRLWNQLIVIFMDQLLTLYSKKVT